MPTISTCNGCGRVFSSTALFDFHRVGDFGKPRYAKKDTQKRYPTGYTRHTRRCMTEAELYAAGYQFECRSITVTREGVLTREEREIWYDPAAREQMRQAFEKKEAPPPAAYPDDPMPLQAALW